ncbi:hypothetical protein [Sulfolobus tengchongensis spindle-shaped virus 4]|nr:hypothetical protein [Sulfolobus tengchongensis spindle-shaped virus 4]
MQSCYIIPPPLPDLLPALEGTRVPIQSGSSFPPLIRVYISHLVGSRVDQRSTPIWKLGIRHSRCLDPVK